jgi:hypothetical protein
MFAAIQLRQEEKLLKEQGAVRGEPYEPNYRK